MWLSIADILDLIFAAVALYLIAWSLYLNGQTRIGSIFHAASIALVGSAITALWLLHSVSIVWLASFTIVIVVGVLLPLDDAGVSADDDESPSYTE